MRSLNFYICDCSRSGTSRRLPENSYAFNKVQNFYFSPKCSTTNPKEHLGKFNFHLDVFFATIGNQAEFTKICTCLLLNFYSFYECLNDNAFSSNFLRVIVKKNFSLNS